MKKTSFKLSLVALATATMALAASSAHADYGNLNSPVYIAGGVDGGWTFESLSGVTVALRAKNRETFEIYNGSSGTYTSPFGAYAGGNGKHYTSYEFSANNNGTTYNNISYWLGIDNTWVNAGTYWGDNVKFNSTGLTPNAGGDATGFQNSQNVGFPDVPGGVSFASAAGLHNYQFQAIQNATSLTNHSAALGQGSDLIVSTAMNVQIGQVAAVPEPETYAMMLAGLGVIAGIARKRKQKTALQA